MTDSHCHLNHERLLPDIQQVLDRARVAGVTQIVVIGFDLRSSLAAVELAETNDGLWAAVGVHPHEARGYSPETAEQLRVLASDPRTVGIGEIGLDYHYEFSPRNVQQSAFESQLSLAGELGLPVVIHCREAEQDLLRVVRDAGRPPGVLHCWQGSRRETEEALSMGLYVGVGGMITFRRPTPVHELVGAVPLDRLLLETDAPYLAPVPFRGHRNEPSYLTYTAAALAQRYGCSVAELERITDANVSSLFSRLRLATG